MVVLIDVEFVDCKLNQMASLGLSMSHLPVTVSDRALVRQFLQTILVERLEVTGLGYYLSFRGKLDFLYEPPGPLYFSAIDAGIPVGQQFGMTESSHAALCAPSCLIIEVTDCWLKPNSQEPSYRCPLDYISLQDWQSRSSSLFWHRWGFTRWGPIFIMCSAAICVIAFFLMFERLQTCALVHGETFHCPSSCLWLMCLFSICWAHFS